MVHRYKEKLGGFKLRSRISRGKFILADVDHRSAPMKRLKDLLELHASDLGGASNISHAESVLVGRTAVMTLLAEMEEQRFAKQEFENISHDALTEYLRNVNALRRNLEALGLQRRQRDITNGLTLGQLIQQDQLEERQRLSEADDAEIVTEAAE